MTIPAIVLYPPPELVAAQNRTHKETAAIIAELQAEIDVNNKLLAEHGRLLSHIPECPVHGRCIPFAIEWIEKMKAIEAKLGK